jgi:hypothetical protein
MLKAGEASSVSREDESVIGTFSEYICGGGVALRYTGRAHEVPEFIRTTDVEIMRFMSVTSLSGEFADSAHPLLVQRQTGMHSL